MQAPQNLARLTEKKARVNAHRPVPSSIVAKLEEYFRVDWTYNSNAIEGSSITLSETRAILLDGVTIGGKSLREHLEVINHSHAIDFVQGLADTREPITEMTIRQMHNLILRTIDDDNAGAYRRVNVRIAGSDFVPPDAGSVPSLMYDFARWLNQDETKRLHPVEYAALAHFKLVDIHPFVDGNGRTARLLMNLILMRAGFPPTVVRMTDRQRYYASLEQAHAGDSRDFVALIADAVERSVDVYLDALPKHDV
ncbi:MAG: Fic family protein [Chloroflexi bacterium]|nr:Fic family protein [Chloroflexota bacterium]